MPEDSPKAASPDLGSSVSTELSNQLLLLEARLIEQDYRPVRAIYTYVTGRAAWSKTDPRRAAALHALLWHVFFSPTTIAVTGGIVAIGTLLVFIWQNTLIKEQNAYLRDQLAQQQIQIGAQQAVDEQTTRTQAIEQLFGPTYTNTPRVRAEAVRTLVAIERARVARDPSQNSLAAGYLNLHEAVLDRAWLENADLRQVSFRKASLVNGNLNGTQLTSSSFRFATSADGHFISAVMNDTTAAFSLFDRVQFSDAILRGAYFASCSLRSVDMTGADVAGASFVNCDMSGTDFGGIRNWRALSDVSGTCLADAKNAPDGFIEWAVAKGATLESFPEGWLESARRRQLLLEEGMQSEVQGDTPPRP